MTVQLSTADIIVFIAYIVVLLGIGIWASSGKKSNLFLANKSLGWFAIGLTMWGTNVGPSMLV
ncbi:MAG: Na+/glucose cotransporter, partial [Bacteroidales bacterium]|nr:Na+/glucose cotransporter [Bacteroidales bacterium]